MRREFHMSAREVFHEIPEWELEVLIQEWNREQAKAERRGAS